MEETKQVGSSSRWQFLDAIRGIAALAVVLQHSIGFAFASVESFFATIWSPGRFGVIAFFIVSGFIVPRSLELKKDLKAFWTSRFLRLYPAYWISLVFFAIVFALHWAPADIIGKQSVVRWVANISMLHSLVGISNVSPVAWTLSVEMAFYAGITVAFVYGFLHKPRLIAGIVISLLAVASVALPVLVHVRFPAGLSSAGCALVTGLALYRWFTGDIAKSEAYGIAALSFAVTILSCVLNYSSTHGDMNSPAQLSAILSAGTGYVFFMAFLGLKDAQFPSWILWLGKVSYSLYLFHMLVGFAFDHFIDSPIRIIPEIVVSLVVAWLGYTFIEVPTLNLAKRLNDRRLGPKSSGN